MEKMYDVAVLGGGPGGYVAAVRASRLGQRTVLIEKARLGGTCLNWGCIPTKALLHSAEVYHIVNTAANFGINAAVVSFDYKKITARKDQVVNKLVSGIASLVRNAGVTVISGEGKLVDRHTISVNGETVSADQIILATGSVPARLPIPGIESPGVIDSNGVLALDYCPKSLIIIGGGVIGIEFATFFHTLGVKVTVIEMMESILPGIDEEISAAMARHLQKKGVEIITGAKVLGFENDGTVVCEYEKKGGRMKANGELGLVSIGRTPATGGIGLEHVNIATERGKIIVDGQMRTSVDNIYAIGDITGQMQLAHVASAQGLVAAANAAGLHKTMHSEIIPSCIYGSPEIATVGLTEAQALARGFKVKKGRFPVSANGKSMVSGDSEGFVKIITDEQTGEILGAHLMAPRATDMIAEFCALMKAEGTIEELADTIHPHPTVSEMIMEAAHDVEGLSCHLHY